MKLFNVKTKTVMKRKEKWGDDWYDYEFRKREYHGSGVAFFQVHRKDGQVDSTFSFYKYPSIWTIFTFGPFNYRKVRSVTRRNRKPFARSGYGMVPWHINPIGDR